MDTEHRDYYLTKPTIHSGHFENLVLEDGVSRVWVSRCEYGDDWKPLVKVEHLINGKWEVTDSR